MRAGTCSAPLGRWRLRNGLTTCRKLVGVVIWDPFPWETEPLDPLTDRLCHNGRVGDLDCRLEGADLTTAPAPPSDTVVVCAYNVERGLCLDGQLDAFTRGSDAAGMPKPDIVLLSEADRGCSRSGNRNVARSYALALGMYYVYAVEFVELPRYWGPGGGAIRRPCEHGNAILSRYPLGNVAALRHRSSRSWDSRTQRLLRVGQPRLGGRVAVGADVRIGDRLLRVYSVHFESGRLRRQTAARDRYRQRQAGEIIDEATAVDHPVVIGGDMNVVGYLESLQAAGGAEPTIAEFTAAGYRDAHAEIPPARRITTDSGVVIDLIVGRGVTFVDAGIGAPDPWSRLSDHVPVWARVRI